MASELGVVIADDHPIFRKGLRQIIEGEAGLRVIGEAGDGERALELITTLRPAVAVLDMDMPRMNGLAVAQEVRRQSLGVALIVLTMHTNEHVFNAALDAGVRGYVLKENAAEDIVKAILAAAGGRSYVTPDLTDLLLGRKGRPGPGEGDSPLARLSPSERRVLRLVGEGRTSKDIADELFISIRTVDRHRANIAAKLSLTGPHALLQFAIEHKRQL